MTTRPPSLRRTIDARLGLRRPDSPTAGNWVVNMPTVVGWLIGGMVVLFVIGIVLPQPLQGRFEYPLSFVPGRFFAAFEGRPGITVLDGVGPLLSHMFIHGSFGHITMNSMGLAIFGTAVARRLRVEDRSGQTSLWNHAVYLVFLLACGVAGAALYAVFNANSAVPMVGASGAISGLLAASMRFALRPFAPYGPGAGPLASATSLPVMATTVFYVGFNLLTPLGLGTLIGGGLEIAWEAHIGGYLFGLLAFPLFDKLVRGRTTVVYG